MQGGCRPQGQVLSKSDCLVCRSSVCRPAFMHAACRLPACLLLLPPPPLLTLSSPVLFSPHPHR